MKYHLTDFYFRLFVTLIPHPISIPKSEKCCNATVVQLQHYTCVKELFSTKMMPPQGGHIGKKTPIKVISKMLGEWRNQSWAQARTKHWASA